MACKTCNGAGKVIVQGQVFSCMGCPPNQGGAGYDMIAVATIDDLRRCAYEYPRGSHPILDEILAGDTFDLQNRVSGGNEADGRVRFKYIAADRKRFFNLTFDQYQFHITPA